MYGVGALGVVGVANVRGECVALLCVQRILWLAHKLRREKSNSHTERTFRQLLRRVERAAAAAPLNKRRCKCPKMMGRGVRVSVCDANKTYLCHK